MKCSICGNDDMSLFNLINGTYQCRKCLSFTYPIIEYRPNINLNAYYSLPYELTKAQKEISRSLLECIKQKQNVLINAVCGAGKTEIIYDSLVYALNSNKKVGIAIPRKDVVEELYQRIARDFRNISVTRVYGGKTDILDANLIIFTTHQASRYVGCFDLLFIDEVDAFPFANNRVLKNIIKRVCKGNFVYLSATKDKIKGAKALILNKRYHGKDIPVPKTLISYKPKTKILSLLEKLKHHKVVLIFVPTKRHGTELFIFLEKYYKNDICLINSESKDRDKISTEIKENKYKFVITTTIYERGITLDDAQVIVYLANNKIFDENCLLQIVGRVGRTKKNPSGNVYFLSNGLSYKFKRVIKRIKKYNE